VRRLKRFLCWHGYGAGRSSPKTGNRSVCRFGKKKLFHYLFVLRPGIHARPRAQEELVRTEPRHNVAFCGLPIRGHDRTNFAAPTPPRKHFPEFRRGAKELNVYKRPRTQGWTSKFPLTQARLDTMRAWGADFRGQGVEQQCKKFVR